MNKFLLILLSLVLLVFATGLASPNRVVVTADQVDEANDIEFAMEAATAYGTRPGTVILDGSKGPFVFSGDDKSINIFYSDLTLRSVNGARITNCDGGIFFDDVVTQRVTIEGITFDCRGIGIHLLWGDHSQVTIRNNTIIAPMGIIFNQVHGNRVIGNQITAEWQGILLGAGTNDNHIIQNTIRGVQQGGISLEDGCVGNHVHGNKVSCAPGYDCLTVEASPDTWLENNISGNKP